MKKKTIRRIVSLASTAVLGAAALAMFAGCSTRHPEITITYTFNGKDYAVDYTLSRNDAPQTVQHFIELADAGFYDGLCIHDYDSSFLHTGGYKLADGELEEVNYFERVKQLEEAGNIFTQSVWTLDTEPLYTVYGEFTANGAYTQYGNEYSHGKGALVMYYTGKGKYNGDVTVLRADGGKENDGNKYQTAKYAYNCATSLFYTYTGSSNSTLDANYAVFGMAKDYEGQLEDGLLKAISEYTEDLGEEASFTEEITQRLNRYDPIADVAKGDEEDTFYVPLEQPIIVKSVKVNKY